MSAYGHVNRRRNGEFTFVDLVIEEWPLIMSRNGIPCECGHPVSDHHENQVTGDSTYCNECPPGGCDMLRPPQGPVTP